MSTEPLSTVPEAVPDSSTETPEAADPSSTPASDAPSPADEGADQTQDQGADQPADQGESQQEGAAGGRRQELESEGDIAADFLETLLDIADLDGDLEVNVEGDRASVAIVDSEDGAAPTRLVGRDGAVLEALQELTRLAVQAETGDRSRLMLDVAGHRAGRRAQLVELARTQIARVKESGERAELEPMTAFERKVVHDEVLAAGLVSESEGTEPQRFVVILPQG